MALSREIYQEFEDIVGPDNISDDPALLDSYRYPLSHTAIHIGPYFRTFTPRGQGVVLPGSTEEVQGVVRVCNKYKIKFKPSSTFWGARGNISHDYAIVLDMRRMDKILEIDEKNMFAVIEPYVIGASLQAEVMKLGLNTHLIGAGSSCSPLASACGLNGGGPDTIYMGWSPENLLGAEWVMPNGDVVRTGSMGSGLGWFCGEGPGPGIRSIVRGASGAMGSMGVYTKCALKLFPWPGPARLPIEGTIPAYKAVLPDNIRAHTLAWPSWEAWANGCYEIFDAGIGYIAHRQFNMFGRDLKGAMMKILTDPTKTLSDLEEIVKDPEVQKMNENMKRDFQIVLAGMTPRDIEWQEKVLDDILAETGGWKVAAMGEPDLERYTLMYLVRMGHKNLNLVYGGGYDGCFGLGGPPDFGIQHVEEAGEFKRKWEREKNTIVAAGGESSMGNIAGSLGGGGGSLVWEFFTHFDPHDKESTEGTYKFFGATAKFGKKKGYGPAMERAFDVSRGSDGYAPSKEEHERMLSAAPQPVVYHYQWKIREVFNPNDLGDAYYRTLEEPKDKEKV